MSTDTTSTKPMSSSSGLNRFKVKRVDTRVQSVLENSTGADDLVEVSNFLNIIAFVRKNWPHFSYSTIFISFLQQEQIISEVIELGERPPSSSDRATSPTALLSQNNTYTTVNESTASKHATKSLRHMTREALPRLDNYRNILSIHVGHRPTLDELHNNTIHEKVNLNFRFFTLLECCSFTRLVVPVGCLLPSANKNSVGNN